MWNDRRSSHWFAIAHIPLWNAPDPGWARPFSGRRLLVRTNDGAVEHALPDSPSAQRVKRLWMLFHFA